LVDELVDQLAEIGLKGPPDLVVLSVGGGGLLIGVAHGMDRVGWKNVPILAMETVGADCFNAAINAGHLVTLPAITRWKQHFIIHENCPIIF
jgi:L-serine/L-threonine ammonia-lyase